MHYIFGFFLVANEKQFILYKDILSQTFECTRLLCTRFLAFFSKRVLNHMPLTDWHTSLTSRLILVCDVSPVTK